jgi:uncharacterized protein YdaU (DUF1376 family)
MEDLRKDEGENFRYRINTGAIRENDTSNIGGIGTIMAKDPAVLFYYQDFLVGTEFMTDENVGKYIRILCHQADKGSLTEQQVLSICRTSVMPVGIQEKLVVDENGLYYNRRMKEEKEKRAVFSESRRNNALSKKAYAQHMEDEDEDENKDEDIKERWNVFADKNGLSKVLKLTPKRKSGISARLKEKQFDLSKIIEEIEMSKFLCGENNSKWKIDFDFIFLSTNNYVKILEGKYRDKTKVRPEPESALALSRRLKGSQ